jgi:hypothetical protein
MRKLKFMYKKKGKESPSYIYHFKYTINLFSQENNPFVERVSALFGKRSFWCEKKEKTCDCFHFQFPFTSLHQPRRHDRYQQRE